MNKAMYIRDVVIIIGLSFLGGLISGITLGAKGVMDPEIIMGTIAILNIITVSVGFWVVGCLYKKEVKERFNYLGYVGIAVWLFGLINIALGVSTLAQWFASVIFVLICLGIGGGLSLLTCKPRIQE
ncbi:MAG: hypothetical protein JXQ68_04035 [Campylobacterales bacterium]|nr:hypothetical protein [Campylobacterales bacterium]